MQMLTTENSGFFLTAMFQTFLLGEGSREITGTLGTEPKGSEFIAAYPGLICPSV